MSFAPNIPNQKNNMHQQQQNSTPSQPRQYIQYDSPNINNSVRTDKQAIGQQQTSMQSGINQRLEIIEANLNRVCNQHDALMPLLNILEAMPQIQKNESEIKSLKNSNKNLETKIKNLETQVNQSSNQHVFGTIERNFKQQNQSITNIKNQIKEIEQHLQHHQKVSEAKQKEDASHLLRNVDTKLEKNKKDIQTILAEFKNSIQIEQRKQEDLYNVLKNPSVVQNQQSQSGKDAGYAGGVEESSSDIQNLYREIGMLRSELELLYDKERRNNIFSQLDQEKPLTDTHEKELVVANLEQAVFFEELERFDRENQERVIYELNCLDDKLQIIQNMLIQQQAENHQGYNEEIRKEITFIEDRFFNLRQQIKGTKKKYLVDVRKLEDRLDNLFKMKEFILHQNEIKSGNQSGSQTPLKEEKEHLQKHLIIIDSYPSRVDRLNQSIVDNIENFANRQKIIEDKLLSVHKQLQK